MAIWEAKAYSFSMRLIFLAQIILIGSPLLATDKLLGELRQKGSLMLAITDSRGQPPERAVFQSNKKQKMLSSAACLAASSSDKKVCREDGTILLRLESLRLVRQKNDRIRVTLRSNLGTFGAEPLLTAKQLFSGDKVSLRFPKSQKKWAGAFDLTAEGNMTIQRNPKGFLIPKLNGSLGVFTTWFGFKKAEQDKAELKNLMARP